MARIVLAVALFALVPVSAQAQDPLPSAALQTGLPSASLQMRTLRIAPPRDVFVASPTTYAPGFEEPHRVDPRVLGCCGAFVGAPLFFPGFAPGVVHVPGYFPGFANAIGSVTPSWERRAPFRATGSAGWLGYLRLLVEPETTQVFVDGFYVGTVAGLGRLVTLEPGPHRLEFRASGYEAAAVEIQTLPTETITYRAALTPSGSSLQPPAPPPSPGPPKTFYVIPSCYAGDRPPDPGALPRGCDVANLRTIPPVVK